MNLALSAIALILGPFLFALGQRNRTAQEVVDGFIFITIAGIVFVHIVPEAIEAGGIAAVLFLALGLAFPVLVERVYDQSLHRAHTFIVLLAAVGLALHATIDGIALLPTTSDVHRHGGGVLDSLVGNSLALGVILHRVPVGMAIWWSVRSSLGVPAAIGTFALIIGATAIAYWFGQPVVHFLEGRGIGYFQAFVSGSLVHVVAFGVSHDHGDAGSGGSQPARGSHWGYRVGILLGMFLVGTAPNLYT